MGESGRPEDGAAQARVHSLESKFHDLANSRIAREADEELLTVQREAYAALVECAKFLLPQKPKSRSLDRMKPARIRRRLQYFDREDGWADEWDAPPPKKSELEKAWPAANPAIAHRWVVLGWLPTVGPVRRALGRFGVEAFEPASPVHDVVRTLYLRLFDEEERESTLKEVEDGLMRLRSKLAPGDALPWNFFYVLAKQIGTKRRSSSIASIGESSESDSAQPIGVGVDRLEVVAGDNGSIAITRLVENGPLLDQYTISREQLVRLFTIVSSRPGEFWDWREVEQEWAVLTNWKSLIKISTIRRYGRDLRDALMPVGFTKYWRYSSDSVGWFPPSPPADK